EGLKYATDRGLPVVIMEPLRGGQIIKKPPESVAKLWDSVSKKRTVADWALQWVWHHAEIPMLLSGMSEMKHVEENLASADRALAGSLTEEELAIIDKVREEYSLLCPIPCTNCRYCMPCQHNVDIPFALLSYNNAIMYDDAHNARLFYQQLPLDQQANNCEECYECEDVCPQGIPIVDWLKKAHAWVGPRKN
ncbi:4Fe-4S dicluster domain-containing protein, partial [bacterium]|nr:4Fe-4S dicluster domain-containing protein [bacterium]